MADRISPVRLGSRVCFEDRWQGRVSGLEVDEDWNVFNIGVSSGFIFAQTTVRLPFTSVTAWSHDSVTITANSFQAFAREIPPVAAPARPLDAGIPTSQPGTKFAGLVVRAADRRAVEMILSRGLSGLFRVPISEISFSGKTMTIAVPPDQMDTYYPDARILEEIRERIAEDRTVPTDDKRYITVDVEDGIITLAGNVRVALTREYAEVIASNAHGAVTINNEIRDDFEIESAIGTALDAAGSHSSGRVYVRSNLGEIGVDGSVPTQRAVEDAVRTVARVPGVRSVINRLRVVPAPTRG